MFLRTIIKAFVAQLITLKPLMVKRLKKPNNKPKKTYSIAEAYGYTHKDFKKWGKLGGRPAKYVNDSERYKAYVRRKNQAKLTSGERIGLLNMTTGRINKYSNSADRQKAYRLRKKLNEGK
jgi:hypothetical protein